MERENDIVKDAYYLVSLFKKDNKSVTQLHIQKLMFLVEAFYMCITNESQLYECQYKAWNFGPVATQLYKKFKIYGKEEIVLNESQIADGESITEEKKNIIKAIYEVFKEFSAMDLVKFTHAEGSPWKKAWDNEQYSVISKEEMKNWFSKYVKN
ncbi:Panacea domain-containing protein [uncultured Clostridium sp.]|uniref:Panacea domain-containing protein n=1 Tax=uncultured Clostridium sp. TaxID=59620 RepID=UPI00272E9E70|nr:type II toxin-antitoxin system antitoxin SocA domain-containing protein [uncultured Clostridium sp.]